MRQTLRILRNTSKVLFAITLGVAIYGVIAVILARFTSRGD